MTLRHFTNTLRNQTKEMADNEIVKRLSTGDLVITSDIPLADEVITKGGSALSPRGELLTADNIKSKLSMRDFMDVIRSSGIQTGGISPLSQTDMPLRII
jgi:uncharacterized protein YaiI (UPF0178 family)